MHIREIELRNFRNYEEEKVSFSEKVNIFLGRNAQGKTNLLEGIYLNAFGRSFKSVKDKELIKFGENYCRVSTAFASDGEEKRNEIVISRDGKKGIKADGTEIKKTSELLERMHIVIFSPEDLKIVKEEPEKRRRFINRELCQIRHGYLSDLNDYNKVLKQRNSYLKEENVDLRLLDVWDTQMAGLGGRIIKRRKNFIERINEISREIHHEISGGKENLEIRYEPNIYFEEDLEENYYHMLTESVEDDIKNRTTGKGPHRDDFRISSNGVDLRKFGSQGQQRTAALSLKLSEIKIIEEEKNIRPVLLLDDVLSELDNERQIYLMNMLGDNQMFITTTDLTDEVRKNLPEGSVFHIEGGYVKI